MANILICDIETPCPPGYTCVDGYCQPDGTGDPPPGGDPGDPPLTGLSTWLATRYSSNVVISEQGPVLDIIYDVLNVADRGYFRQDEFGRIGLLNKKPVPFAFVTEAISIGESSIDADNVRDWIGTEDTWLLIAPHTNKSEIRKVSGAAYSTDQNDVVLDSSGGLFTLTDFAGCDGAETPATGSIQVDSATADTACSITVGDLTFFFTTSSGDSVDSIAGYIAGVCRTNTAIARRFDVDWPLGSDTVTLTPRFGTLTLDAGTVNAHAAPLADPADAPTVTAISSGAPLIPGVYIVAFSYENENGETLLGKFKRVTVTTGQNIDIDSITLPAGVTAARWYVSPAPDSQLLRYYVSSDGSGFTISDGALPRLTDPTPPDLNRTGTEVMRVEAVFSDKAAERTTLDRANVLKSTLSWETGNPTQRVNRIDLKYRDATQDYRLVTLHLRDKAHIDRVKKEVPSEVNGQAINNDDQAGRIASGLLAERQDADFFENWTSLREAMLLQEGDVVAVSDSGQGVVNIPVMLEDIEYEFPTCSMPIPKFAGRKYSSRLYDDSVNEAAIPVVNEA